MVTLHLSMKWLYNAELVAFVNTAFSCNRKISMSNNISTDFGTIFETHKNGSNLSANFIKRDWIRLSGPS